jgi:hypothetical protein
MRTRKRNRKTNRKGGMIAYSKVTKRWIPGLHTRGIVHEYSNSEASFLNRLGVGNVMNQWFFNPQNAVAYFRRLDPTNVLQNEVPKHEFDKVYLDMGIAMNSLREAYSKRSLNDDDIARLPEEVRDQFTTEKRQVLHTDRTDALGHILDELELIFKEYTVKHKEFTPQLPPPAPEPESNAYAGLQTDEPESRPDDGEPFESLPPQTPKPKIKTEFNWDTLQIPKPLHKDSSLCARPDCKNVGTMYCGNCLEEKYCSPECQKICWKKHKLVCSTHYVTTLPFYLEKVTSIAMDERALFSCFVTTKTQVLNIREISNIYIGPFLFSQEKDGRITNAKNDISRKLFALLEEKGEGFERNMLKLLHEKNQGDVVHVNEEEMPAIKERFLEAYHETEKLVAKREEHKQEVIGLLQQLYESKKMPEFLAELKQMIQQNPGKTALDLILFLPDILNRIRKLYPDNKLIADSYVSIGIYNSLNDKYDESLSKMLALKNQYSEYPTIGTHLYPPSGLLLIPNGLFLTMDNFVYYTLQHLKIGSTRGYQDGKPGLCKLNNPTDMAYVDNNLFIVDTNNHCIRLLDFTRGEITTIGGDGTPGYVNGKNRKKCKFNHPRGIALDVDGSIIVADTNNDCIRKIIMTGGTYNVITIAGREPHEKTSLLNRPTSVCLYNSSILVSDTGNHCINKIDFVQGSFKMKLFAGTRGQPGYANGIPALFSSPCKLVVHNGNIFVADRDNDKVRMIVDHIPTPDEFPKGLIL